MESLETVKENHIASLETVALDHERWQLTADRMKHNWARARSLILGLSIAAAILAALAVQTHTPYPVASEAAGYAGAAALALVVVVRAQGLRKARVQAWVLADATSQSLQSEMYQYRASSGPYSDRFGAHPEATLLERRDEILEKTIPIRKYIVEPDPKTVAPLGPLDADTYISERVNKQINQFRVSAGHVVAVQTFWQKVEYFLAVAGALLGAVLTFTHTQEYGAWVAVITTMCVAVGPDLLAERFAQIVVSCQAMPDRLTSILGRWRANHGTLDQLVEQVEATLIKQGQAWVAEADEFLNDAALSQAKDSPPMPALHSPASRTA
jgi:hypothetical protein